MKKKSPSYLEHQELFAVDALSPEILA